MRRVVRQSRERERERKRERERERERERKGARSPTLRVSPQLYRVREETDGTRRAGARRRRCRRGYLASVRLSRADSRDAEGLLVTVRASVPVDAPRTDPRRSIGRIGVPV